MSRNLSPLFAVWLRSDILVLAIFSRRRDGASPSGNIKGAITLESGKTKRAAASAVEQLSKRGASRRAREGEARAKGVEEKVERELYALRERERASRWIARPFVERRRAAAFTSSEPFPSTFQIMRKRNPPVLQYRARESVSVRIMRLAAHARISFSLSLFSPLSSVLPRTCIAATVLPERRDLKPDNEIGEAAFRSKPQLVRIEHARWSRARRLFPYSDATSGIFPERY